MPVVLHSDLQQIELVCLGTTHFINALIRQNGLVHVAVLRLCGPATRALPPFCDMPAELIAVLGQQYYMLPGKTFCMLELAGSDANAASRRSDWSCNVSSGPYDSAVKVTTLREVNMTSACTIQVITSQLMIVTAGGYEYDGKTEIAPVNPKETADAVRDALTKGIASFVVSGVFSPTRSIQ